MKPKHVTKSACATFYFKDWFVASAASGHPLRHQNKRWQMASPLSVTQNRNTVLPPYPLCSWPVTCQVTGGALRHWCEWTIRIVSLGIKETERALRCREQSKRRREKGGGRWGVRRSCSIVRRCHHCWEPGGSYRCLDLAEVLTLCRLRWK